MKYLIFVFFVFVGSKRGRDITYSNPIRTINYGTVKSGDIQAELNKNKFENSDNVAVIIRNQMAGKIIAAGKMKL